ncbi:tripartite motif-containing protein 59 [Octopus bimaculoides]|uniref:RING-type domain-containing protein n=1 Tax=Octopus bimaculoides TaxID=37653 RepID=A0A0L8G651_OCTBM|nr:tripartite motif-containing protein 59 [Octopus bimaculoides]|eukprot:XP_014783696.1 PREDICTED: tripartite motif-containing protein 59-like [Octopus bimaculoides]
MVCFSITMLAAMNEDNAVLSGRNLIIDESSFEENFLRCMICREKFSKQEHLPKFLQCNHTFCLLCLKNVLKHSNNNSQTLRPDKNILRCPTCRKETCLPYHSVDSLPTDHRIIQMMDFLSVQQTDLRLKSQCMKHGNQPVYFFCSKCRLPVCQDCTIFDHNEQDGHIITDLKTELESSAERFTEIGKRCQECIKSAREMINGHTTASKRLDVIEKQIKCIIKETFIEYRLLLEKREKALAEKATEMIREQKSKKDSRFEEPDLTEDSLERHKRSFPKVRRGSNDMFRFFNIEKEIDSIIKKDEATDSDDTDDKHSQTTSLERYNEVQLTDELNSLDQVIMQLDPTLKNPLHMMEPPRTSKFEDKSVATYPVRDAESGEHLNMTMKEKLESYENWISQAATLERRRTLLTSVKQDNRQHQGEVI